MTAPGGRQTIRYLETEDGFRLAWAEAGAGPPLVKAATWLTHLEYDWESPVWHHWNRFFADHFRFVRYDERGSGMSGRELGDLSGERLTADFAAVVEAARPEGPMALLGISQGAAVAIAYAARHPERVSHLLLCGGYARGWAMRGDEAGERRHRAVLELVSYGWGRDNPTFRQLFTSNFIPKGTAEQLRWFNELCRKTTSPANAALLLESRGATDVVALLPQLRVPTLVAHARSDHVVPIEEGRFLAAGIRGATFVELDSANHILLEDEPAWERFCAAILDFVGLPPHRSGEADVAPSRSHRSEAVREERLADLYLEALDLDEAGRRELVDRQRASEPTLAEELARLLATPEGAPSPIDGSALAAAGVAWGALAAPERVGPYRILRELGRGGMGRVFLAEQETPDFRRTVALKLIDRPGPDEEAVRRFRAEVRILASLDHPGIVRFLDGGRSPEGTWFLALEYVEGDDLVSYASLKTLDVPERLRLFLAVAEAVEFAHQRGVVHRDLKPANVLVGRDGRPRLLDFGISKLTSSSASSVNLTVTRTDLRPLTPAYASPEQLAGQPATPASDVYALGIVLFELLAGRRPFTSDAADSTSRRPTTGRIDRSLDTICARALESDPAARYPHAGALAADLRRHLEGRPVEARRRRRWRRAGAVLGRGRPRLLAAGAAGLALLLLGGAVWIAGQRSGDRSSEASQTAQLAGFPFDPVNPPLEEMESRFAAAPDDVAAGAALVVALLRQQRESEAGILVGRLRQIPGKELDPLIDYAEGRLATRRGENQRALVLFTSARDNAAAQGREELLGTIRWARGAILSRLGQRDAARQDLELARADFERAGDPRNLYRVLNDLSIEYLQIGRMEQGEAVLESALAAARLAGFAPVPALGNLAVLKFLRGRPDLAEPLAREALELRRDQPSTVREASERAQLAAIVNDLGRPEEADALLDQAISLGRADGGTPPPDALYFRALADLDAGRLDRIDSLAQELESEGNRTLRFGPVGYGYSVRARAAALAGDFDGARRHFTEARRLLRSEGDRDFAALSDLAWAEAEVAASSPQAASRVLDEAFAGLEEAATSLAGILAEALRLRIEAAAGRIEAGRERLARLGKDGASAPSVACRIAYLRGRARLAAAEGRKDAARADLEAALAAARQAQRKVDELELRLDVVALAGDPATRARLASEVEREAAALGLSAIAGRARAAARATPTG